MLLNKSVWSNMFQFYSRFRPSPEVIDIQSSHTGLNIATISLCRITLPRFCHMIVNSLIFFGLIFQVCFQGLEPLNLIFLSLKIKAFFSSNYFLLKDMSIAEY